VPTDSGVVADINNVGIAGCPASPGEQLVGFNDWANIVYNFRTSIDFGDGAHASIDASKAADKDNTAGVPPGSLEMTFEEATTISYDRDGDGIPDIADNCPLTKNADQLDANGNGIGDACEISLLVLRPSVPSTSQGVVQIAMLSTATRDATMIDGSTAVLTGSSTTGPGIWSLRVTQNSVGTAQCSKRDVNGDGRADLVCQFKVDARLLPTGTSNLVLDALTLGGEAVRGVGVFDVTQVGNGS
jgi:hypothetical protein